MHNTLSPLHNHNIKVAKKQVGKKDATAHEDQIGTKFSTVVLKNCMAKTNRKTSKNSSPSKKKSTKEIVRRHLRNEKDQITESDLKNVKIDLSIPKDKAHEPLKIKRGKERPKDVDKDKTMITPWDVLGG